MDEKKINPEDSEKPPILKSWNKLYAFVIAQTAVLILMFYLFTRFFK